MLKLVANNTEPNAVERGNVDTDDLRRVLARARIRCVADFDPHNPLHVVAAVAAILAAPQLLDACDAYHASRNRPSGVHPCR